MNSDVTDSRPAPLDLSAWSFVPTLLIVAGVIAAAVGVLASEDHTRQFGFSWLLAFMFFLSIGVGGWFLVMVHHLFDASWSVPIRRVPEALACLLAPPMLVLFLPLAVFAPIIYPYLAREAQLHPDHAIMSKYPLFTTPGYYISAAVLFAVWWFFSSRLRYWSLQQDSTGSFQCTRKMRIYSCLGIVCFALSVTLAAIMWMKGLMDEWYSTMYGVCYFAASVWTTIPTVYAIVLILQRKGDLRGLVGDKTYYFLGSLFFAFTVFWAYVNFAQYFIIWNANMPDETFWYNWREQGTWNYVGKFVIIFGHFFVPFLMLLRIDWKLKIIPMIPLAMWAWFMHFIDLEFQIMPVLHPKNIINWGLLSDIGCILLFAGILTKIFAASFSRHPAYPLRDPRMAEALEIYVPPHSDIATAPTRAK
jgi:hypothetical protein